VVVGGGRERGEEREESDDAPRIEGLDRGRCSTACRSLCRSAAALAKLLCVTARNVRLQAMQERERENDENEGVICCKERGKGGIVRERGRGRGGTRRRRRTDPHFFLLLRTCTATRQ